MNKTADRNNRSYTLITGASHGIGKAMAEECAKRGMNLALIALPDEQLHHIERRIQDRYEVEVCCLGIDLTRDDAIEQVKRWLADNKIQINTLINNAGIGSSGHFDQVDPGQFEREIQLNILSVVMLSRHLIGELKQNTPSHIMNVGSLAGFTGVPYKSIYTATKAFVNNFTMALQRELRSSDVHVTLLCPGSVATNIEGIRRAQQHGWLARKSIMDPDEVAEAGIKGMMHGKSMVIPGLINRFFYLLTRILPSSLQTFLLMNEFKREMAAEDRESSLQNQPPVAARPEE
ncbi:MAG: SDR family oxidoreductase [Balneolaceae bacterium]|nr:SDR family oxidoreductase [Balneolaceae bacterium]